MYYKGKVAETLGSVSYTSNENTDPLKDRLHKAHPLG